jgi:hypothetical protein
MAFDMDRVEAASASVEPEAPPKFAVPKPRRVRAGSKLGADLAKTSGAFASASVEPLRRSPVELKAVRLGTALAKTAGASLASETVIKESAARIAGDMARVKAGSVSVESEAPLKVALSVAVPQSRAEVQPVNLRVNTVKTPYASLVEAERAIVIDRLLSQAKLAIEAGRPREAAAAMYVACEIHGAKQQKLPQRSASRSRGSAS